MKFFAEAQMCYILAVGGLFFLPLLSRHYCKNGSTPFVLLKGALILTAVTAVGFAPLTLWYMIMLNSLPITIGFYVSRKCMAEDANLIISRTLDSAEALKEEIEKLNLLRESLQVNLQKDKLIVDTYKKEISEGLLKQLQTSIDKGYLGDTLSKGVLEKVSTLTAQYESLLIPVNTLVKKLNGETTDD